VKKSVLASIILALGLMFGATAAQAQGVTLPNISMGFKSTQNPTEVVNTIKIIMILTVLTLAPAILIMMTSFTRLIIVLSFLRQAIGTQQMPPNQLLIGLSLFLSLFIMSPAITEINEKALKP